MSKKQDLDLHFKIVLIGDSGVGKSNVISKFTKNEFNPESKTTIGVQFATKTLKIESKTIKVQVWDTAGQERYRSMASAYYRGAHGALLVYDITRASSFQNLQKWQAQLRNYAVDEMVCLLIGNKTDLKQYRSLKYEHGEQYAKKNGMAFLQTSALEGFNINEAFEHMISQILKRNKCLSDTKPKANTTKKDVLQIQQIPQSKKKCCNAN